ncbi:uncharacterized protein LOC121050645 [Rosa chinensis]|uniref:uncharacterized protein LOC121050645 n=1 Tax=Rosa chinensis TaxID=74649 RepID=UPI001AD914A9|nr:uncharacterized protein LOC121050645 [Rosa chinensis]
MKKVDANPTTKSNIEKIGNFKVKGDQEEADKGVLKFVYDVSAEEKETIVDSKNFFTSRKTVWSLKPNGWVEDDIINLFSDYLFLGRFPSNRCCYFTTYFCQKMKSYNDRDMCGDSARAVSKGLGVQRFENGIPECEKLQTLDIIYHHVEFKVKNVVKKFSDFHVFKLAQCSKQEGGSDCGVYVIKHMQCYGYEWWHQFNSEEVRMDLTIELVRNKFNECWKWIKEAIKTRPPPICSTPKMAQRETKAESKKGTVKNPIVQPPHIRAQSKRGVASNVRHSR